MNARHPMGVLHSISFKYIIDYDKMDLRLFYFAVVIFREFSSVYLNDAFDFSVRNVPKGFLLSDKFPQI